MSIAEYGYAGNDILYLICCCAEMATNINLSDVPPEPTSLIPNSHNPPKYGCAYYFTEHGCQVRKMRRFNANKGECNYDNVSGELCNEIFPQVNKKGTSDLFLWFCPFHGHCYGFHHDLKVEKTLQHLYTPI